MRGNWRLETKLIQTHKIGAVLIKKFPLSPLGSKRQGVHGPNGEFVYAFLISLQGVSEELGLVG